MVTFSIALLLLIAGYFVYGAFVERVFAPDYSKKTPAMVHPDGVDYLPLPSWRVFMIQFLNIAGLGPIFGAIMGAKFGTASYLWIVLGTIFAGAVHDFLAGMISLSNDGESLPQIIGRYLGKNTQKVFGVFAIILMILVGAVFVSGPAEILASMTEWNPFLWIAIIFAYYVLATLLPIDKIIGRVYPIFAIALIFMALGLLVMLLIKQPELPEMWNGFGTKYETNPIFPMMFISIACGAISGFHATQSPLMARCMKNVRIGRPIFYGAMVTEGIVALIWAAVATYFFAENGIADETGKVFSGAAVAKSICHDWLGSFGYILAMLGIVFAPITSGDTALRSARLMVADAINMEQRSIPRRLMVSIPLFVLTIGILAYSLIDKNGFAIIWRYFAWCNQTLSVFTLWAITVYLFSTKKAYFVTLIPALFMTAVCTTYMCVAPECLGGVFPALQDFSYIIGIAATVVSAICFYLWSKKN
ncbi:MAG: carbon starvation protein A [Bacteroidales bacterium]|nr:carbon starvation protein A [Bacteroidales bacterium]